MKYNNIIKKYLDTKKFNFACSGYGDWADTYGYSLYCLSSYQLLVATSQQQSNNEYLMNTTRSSSTVLCRVNKVQFPGWQVVYCVVVRVFYPELKEQIISIEDCSTTVQN